MDLELAGKCAFAASKAGGAQTLGRGLQLAALIMESNSGGLRMSELCALTGLNKSTVHRLLSELVAHGLVTRDDNRRYRLGRLAYEMGVISAPAYDLRSLCETSLDRLGEMTGDTVFLGKRSGASSICIDHRIGPHVRAPTVPPRGFVQPLGVGALGLAVLSQLADPQVSAINEANRRRLASYRGLSPGSLSEFVLRTRRSGFSRMGNYVAHGVVSLGLCVADRAGRPLLGISVATTAGRMSRGHERDVLDAMYAEADIIRSKLAASRLPSDAFEQTRVTPPVAEGSRRAAGA